MAEPSNCTHDCSTCQANCSSRAPQHEAPHAGSNIRHVIGVVSGTYSSIFIATPIMMWWYRGKRPEFTVETKEEK